MMVGKLWQLVTNTVNSSRLFSCFLLCSSITGEAHKLFLDFREARENFYSFLKMSVIKPFENIPNRMTKMLTNVNQLNYYQYLHFFTM